MPKLYYPTPDELVIGNSNTLAEPVTEIKWFRLHQDLLVLLANTHEGRELLCIDSWKDMPFPVIGIAKNEVRFDASRELGPRTCISDFRVGAKWGNVIRWRWQAVKKALDKINLQHLLSLPQFVLYEGRKLAVPCGAATLTEYPDAHPESTSVDGYSFAIAFSGASWSTLRGLSGYGGQDNNTIMSWGFDSGGGGGGPFTVLRRSYTIFDTSAIGSTSTVSAATMSYYVASIATWGGGGDATWNVYLKSGSGFSTSVGSGDQNTLGTTAQSSPKTSSSTSTGVYTSFTLNTMGNISKTSATRMGFKSANNDADNSAPPNPTVTTYSQNCSVYAADVTGESKDPKLVVTYTLPTTAAVTGEIGNGATEQAVRSAT